MSLSLPLQAAESIQKDPLGITGEASSNTFTSARGVYLRGPAMTREDLNVTMPELMRESSPFLRWGIWELGNPPVGSFIALDHIGSDDVSGD